MADYDGRIKAYRFVAYSTVSFSIISLLSVCFTLPMLKSYVSNVGTKMDAELSSCQVNQIGKYPNPLTHKANAKYPFPVL